jgi:hypothetical protein
MVDPSQRVPVEGLDLGTFGRSHVVEIAFGACSGTLGACNVLSSLRTDAREEEVPLRQQLVERLRIGDRIDSSVTRSARARRHCRKAIATISRRVFSASLKAC